MDDSKKRGQAAIEFLMTYGWAITAVLVVISALVYFGITNPATSLPDKCIFSNGFDCKDYQMNSNSVKLKVVNTLGQTMFGTGTSNIIYANLTDTGAACTTTPANIATLDPDNEIDITCNSIPGGPYNVNEKAKVKVTITYARSTGGYSQVALGELYATVQS